LIGIPEEEFLYPFSWHLFEKLFRAGKNVLIKKPLILFDERFTLRGKGRSFFSLQQFFSFVYLYHCCPK